MNPQESQLHYPLGDQLPPEGGTLEVADGVRWIRMRLPFALDHINLWLLRDRIDGREGWSVVDCCIARDEARSQWERVFDNELQGLPVLRVIVTHMHPDHIGLADWLCKRWKVPLWISATDYQTARTLVAAGDNAAGGEEAAVFFAAHGLTDPEALAKLRARTHYYSDMVPSVPPAFVRMMDGDTVRIGGRAWRCIAGYGHAPEHISLYCDELKVLLGGDMMLPRISTNVSVFAGEPESNPLRLFLTSIERFRELPADTLGLPAHGKPFRGVHTRVDQLQQHHAHHLQALREACAAQPLSAAQALPVLFKRALDLHQTTFAMGETVAHLHYLMYTGELIRTRGPDGIYRFAPAA